jgi:hypothetical protein
MEKNEEFRSKLDSRRRRLGGEELSHDPSRTGEVELKE